MIFAVHYTYSASTADLRDEHRPAHRAWLGALYEAGQVLASGPYPDGSGALILIQATDAAAGEALLADDPFRAAGAIDAVECTEWVQVFGPFDA